MEKPISIKYFEQGEKFYTLYLPILLIAIFMVLMLILLFIFHRKGKKMVLLTVALEAILVIATFSFSQHFGRYYELAKEIRPNIRTVQPSLSGYKGFDRETFEYYDRVQNRETIEALGIYGGTEVKQDVEYLGKAFDQYFFTYYDSIFYLKEKVYFGAEKSSILKGVQYKLNALEFEEIGFVPETNHLLDGLYIPESEKDKEFDTSLYNLNETRNFETKQRKWAVLDS